MCVPGAITATSAASVMMKPAEAARAPDGPTKTTTGARDVIMRETIVARRVEQAPGRPQDDDDDVGAGGVRRVDDVVRYSAADGMDDAVELGDDGEGLVGRGGRSLSELRRRPQAQTDKHGDSNPRHAHILSTVCGSSALTSRSTSAQNTVIMAGCGPHPITISVST